MRKLWFRRKAVSTMIGGIIVLSLFLIALVAMVVVSQQYDAYQNTVNAMSQKDIDRFSEVLVTVYPGLAGGFTVPGCGAGGKCNQYNMTLSNLGVVGVQIARVYINSTGSGCTVKVGFCVLSPAGTRIAYAFSAYDGFLNPGEMFHTVRLWLPSTMTLPNETLTPSNTISIVTTRGRVFTFQYPFPTAGPAEPGKGASPSIRTGVMKIAYNAANANSTKEGTLGINPTYCHMETKETLPFGGTSKLTFVKPWITDQILGRVCATTGDCSNFYIYANTTNSLTIPVTISQGNLIISTADAASNSKAYFVGGPLVGVIYPTFPAKFTAAGTPVTIDPGARFILIFSILTTSLTGSASAANDIFSGTATVNNGAGSQAEDSSFRALAIYLDGLYVRSAC
jgi:hypothetical protein